MNGKSPQAQEPQQDAQSRITLFSGTDGLVPTRGAVGLLFECAPDSSIMAEYPGCFPLNALIGDFDDTKRRAYALALKLLDREPLLRGVPQLGVFEELVIRELQHLFHAIRLFNTLVDAGIGSCAVSSRSRCLEGLSEVAARFPGALRLVETRAEGGPRGRWGQLGLRVLRRLSEKRFSGEALRAEWEQVLRRIDPFHRRASLFRPGAVQSGGVWFYSTSYTFTRIGLMYEPFFEEPFRYLVESPLTGGRPLREAQRKYQEMYGFAEPGMVPSVEETARAAAELTRHLRGVPLAGEEALARDLFAEGSWFAHFVRDRLPFGLFQAALFARFLDRVGPKAVVVGNPVHEGYLLYLARARGIPSVLLQHGVLGDFCQLLDPPVDHYVVRGTFWQDFLAPKARGRSQILNPSQEEPPRVREGRKSHILFLTAPYHMMEFLHEADLREIIGALMQVAADRGSQLMIRVHPLEHAGYYRSMVERIRAAGGGAGAEVKFSSGSGLEEAVRQSAVAVTYSSTVFLDCLRHNVPIVGFGWHDFSYKELIGSRGVFHLAGGVEELKAMVSDAVAGKLSSFAGSVVPFLARTEPEAIRRFFSGVVASRAA